MTRYFLMSLALASALLAAFGAFSSPAGGEEAPAYIPEAFERRPGILFYLFQEEHFWRDGVFSAVKHATADYLTAPAALECYFPPVEGGAGWLAFDVNQSIPHQPGSPAVPADSIGVSFYVKGDGSAGRGRMEARTDYCSAGPGVEFDLSDRRWRRVLATWSELGGDVEAAQDLALAFGIAGSTKRPASYVVDGLRFVTTAEEDGELAALAASADARARAHIPYRPSPAACAYNKEGLAVARAMVRYGAPLRWLAYGDSVTVPVQLWNIPEQYRSLYAYYSVAARMLEDEFGASIDITVDAKGGRQLNEEFETLINLLEDERPDVLIMHPGDTMTNYAVYMPRVLAKAREVDAEILLVLPVYDAYPYRDVAIDWLRRWAIENGVACADARTYLLATGEPFWGELFANPQHPGPEGHRLMGQVVAEMFR